MTREIIETILSIENKAENIIAQAKGIAQNLQLETDKQLAKSNEEFKVEIKELKERIKIEIEEKSAKEKTKITEKQQQEITKINSKAKKNAPAVKKILLEAII